MNEDYRIERLDFSKPEDMQRLVDLQNAVYKGVHIFNSDLFKFWYLDNPNGKVFSFNAIYNNVIAAHYAVIPIKMNIGDRVVNGALSMATVTHPEHRGKGLFKLLAQKTYECAKEEGREFVVGVANANSFPGFIKHLGFYEVGQLDVLYGLNDDIKSLPDRLFSVHWSEKSLQWRVNKLGQYFQRENNVYGYYPVKLFNKCPLLHTFMGVIPSNLGQTLSIGKSPKIFRPFNLYVGMGSNARSLGYKPVPSFIKHSPFHLIFLDMTGGNLPLMTKENVFFQLMDFDVA